MMTPDLNLMIIWENARSSQEEILNDLDASFTLCECIDIGWTKELFHNNLTRFYGQKLPNGSFKEKHCGNGRFLLITFIDDNPNYTYRETSKGEELVNINVFDKKVLYREWTGGGHKIHATNGAHEIKHDLMLLLGKDAESYLEKTKKHTYKKEKTIKLLNKDLEGANGWNSFEHLFKVLNTCINYVVMRNFENLPGAYQVDEHGDIDFLSEDMKEMSFLINGKIINKLKRPCAFNIKVNNKDIPCDIRSIGDGYYDKRWQNNILDNAIDTQGFKIPSPDDFLAMLIYHALLHKVRPSDSYIHIFQKNNLSLEQTIPWLENFMRNNNYIIEIPKDISVYFNYDNQKLLNIKSKTVSIFSHSIRLTRQLALVDSRVLAKKILTKGKSTLGNS